MVLIVDDNKELVNNIIDEFDLEDINTFYCSNVLEFNKFIKSEDMLNIKDIVMDYNLEDCKNGINLLMDLKASNKSFDDLNISFFSGNINQISNNELNFIVENNINKFCKTEVSSMIDSIIDRY